MDFSVQKWRLERSSSDGASRFAAATCALQRALQLEGSWRTRRSEEHTSELQSQSNLIIPLFFFNDTATTEIYPLSLHDALPISSDGASRFAAATCALQRALQLEGSWRTR